MALFITADDIEPRRDRKVEALIAELPRLTEDDLDRLEHADDSCPICYVSYKAFIAEEEIALASEHSAAIVTEELGVTSLNKTCGHVFCRRDIIKWMRTTSKSCPVCRRPFLEGSVESADADADIATESAGFGLLATEEEMRELLRRFREDQTVDEEYRVAGSETYGMYS